MGCEECVVDNEGHVVQSPSADRSHRAEHLVQRRTHANQHHLLHHLLRSHYVNQLLHISIINYSQSWQTPAGGVGAPRWERNAPASPDLCSTEMTDCFVL